MQIIWNTKDFCWELIFDRNNFQNNLDCAKGAGFKTTGPPSWIWYTEKVKVLKAIRENRPTEGLTITEEARKEFNDRVIEEDKKEAVMKYARDVKARLAGKPTEDERKAKREEREKARTAKGKGPVVKKVRQARGGAHIPKEVVKYEPSNKPKFVPPPPPTTLCIFCGDPVYEIYEKIDPLPICIWCEKTIADKQGPDENQEII